MGGRRPIALLALVAMLATLAACRDARSEPVAGAADTPDAITVGSFDFDESHLLAEIYSQALESSGFQVRRAFDLGPREFVVPALARGMIDFVPEYAGTALRFLSLGRGPAASGLDPTYASLQDAAAAAGLTALRSSPAQNANTFVVTRPTADAYELKQLSDLEAVAGRFTFGGPPECASRPLCLAGLRNVYGLTFGEVVVLDVGGPQTRQALKHGQIDVALLFSTDPALAGGELVPLADDRGLQPPENVTPLVRTDVVDRWGPSFVDVVDAVSGRLSTETLRVLNGQAAGDGSDVDAVAAAWLGASGWQAEVGAGRRS